MFEIIFYSDETGNAPVDDFLDEMRKSNFKLYVKTMRMLGLLESTGNMLKMPYSRYIKDGIFELRTVQGNNIARLFYFFDRDRIIVVDHGIIKKSQKTPQKDIEISLVRKRLYEEHEL